MTHTATPSAKETTGDSGGELTDQLFWLSRVDQDLPRAAIVPDRKRTSSSPRVYGAAIFELDPEVVRLLKSVHPSRGLSNVEICAGLLAVLLSKYQRDDRFVLGLGSAGVDNWADRLLPLGVPGGADSTFQSITIEVAQELAQMSTRSPAVLPGLLPILGVETSSHRYPLYDIALVVADAAPTLDVAA
ncbi:MAG: hypothetical protein Q7U73_01620, partial [Rubrivivax sp.]|nr:hypothetical protein [Rubrivivax sp.]